MLTHADIWKAVDKLAMAYGLSSSGLARKSGLDPTTFNKSKRITRDGKLRWPSTESVAKILKATGASLTEFVAYIEDRDFSAAKNLPLIGLDQAASDGYFNDVGHPCGEGWDEIAFPGFTDPYAFTLEVSKNTLEPVFRDGDILVVSPEADVRRGDRVVVKTRAGALMVKVLKRKTAQHIDLAALGPRDESHTFLCREVEWIARVIWASQ